MTGTAILPVVGDEFLLINIYRHAIGGFSWEIPGGFLEEGEDLSKSALRELRNSMDLNNDQRNRLMHQAIATTIQRDYPLTEWISTLSPAFNPDSINPYILLKVSSLASNKV